MDAYHEINDVLSRWTKKEYISKAGNVSEFFMCLDFQNSKDVMEIYKKYDPCKNIENWTSKKSMSYDVKISNKSKVINKYK